jgi:hypothetical protein
MITSLIDQSRQPSNVIARPAVFDRDILALYVAALAQAIAERRCEISVSIRVTGIEKSNHRQGRLLRLRGERPRDCRATEKGNEVAPSHRSLRSADRLLHCAVVVRELDGVA